MGDEGNPCTVEALCLQHYAIRDPRAWEGFHCEGSPVRALFFLHQFQTAPLDLDCAGCFLRNRHECAEKALAYVAAASPLERVQAHQVRLAHRVRVWWNSATWRSGA